MKRVPWVGLGTAPLGGIYDNKMMSDSDAKTLILQAIKNDITFFDTSPYYQRSEEVLGKALRGIPRNSYTLSSKAGRIDDTTFNFSPEWLSKSLQNSLQTLGTSYLDIFLLHDVEFTHDTFESVIMDIAIPHLYQLKQNGYVKAIGLSFYPLEIARRAMAHPNAHLLDVVLTYGHNNLVDCSLENVRDLLHQNRVQIIDASPFAMGLLTTKGPPEWHEASSALKSECQRIALQQKINNGKSLEEIALRFALQNNLANNYACLLLGCRSIDELRFNIDIIKTCKNQNIDEDEIQIQNQLISFKAIQ